MSSSYAVVHVALGMAAPFFTPIYPLFIGYQLLQFAMGVRTFPLEGKVKDGNTLSHTSSKLGQFAVGALFVTLIRGFSK